MLAGGGTGAGEEVEQVLGRRWTRCWGGGLPGPAGFASPPGMKNHLQRSRGGLPGRNDFCRLRHACGGLRTLRWGERKRWCWWSRA